jgi:hypothetical protein
MVTGYRIELYTTGKDAFDAMKKVASQRPIGRGFGPPIKNHAKQLHLQCGGAKSIIDKYIQDLLKNTDTPNTFWLMSFGETNKKRKRDTNKQGARVLKTVQWFGGYLAGHVVNSNMVYIDLVCSQARQGYKLINAAIHVAASIGAEVVQLAAVPNQIDYYKNIGFERHPNACLKNTNMNGIKSMPVTKNAILVGQGASIRNMARLQHMYNTHKHNIGNVFWQFDHHDNRYIDKGLIMSLCINKKLHHLAKAHNNASRHERVRWNNPSSWQHINLNNLKYYYTARKKSITTQLKQPKSISEMFECLEQARKKSKNTFSKFRGNVAGLKIKQTQLSDNIQRCTRLGQMFDTRIKQVQGRLRVDR